MIALCTRRKIIGLYPGRFLTLDDSGLTALQPGQVIEVWPHKAGGPLAAARGRSLEHV